MLSIDSNTIVKSQSAELTECYNSDTNADQSPTARRHFCNEKFGVKSEEDDSDSSDFLTIVIICISIGVVIGLIGLGCAFCSKSEETHD